MKSDEIVGLDGISLRRDFDDELPRVLDVDVGRQLGMAQPLNIRNTIDKYAEDLSDFGFLARRVKNHQGRGRPGYEYWLTKDQALFVAGRSDTERGRLTYKMLVKAFGHFERMVMERVAASVPPLLAEDFQPWGKTWRDDMMREMCRLKGEIFTGRHPRWAGHYNSVIYECLLGKQAYAELKDRNKRPSRGRNHHQLLRPELKERFDKQLEFIGKLAAISGSLRDFEAKLRTIYQHEPFQLRLPSGIAP